MTAFTPAGFPYEQLGQEVSLSDLSDRASMLARERQAYDTLVGLSPVDVFVSEDLWPSLLSEAEELVGMVVPRDISWFNHDAAAFVLSCDLQLGMVIMPLFTDVCGGYVTTPRLHWAGLGLRPRYVPDFSI